MKRITIINGANLNLLGVREPEKYGAATYDEVKTELIAFGKDHDADIEILQSNIEGELVNFIQNAKGVGIILNAGGYTHTSVALRDAIAAKNIPVIEVHITNIAARESFRHTSLLTGVCKGEIMGLGIDSYKLAIRHLLGK